MDLVTLGIIIGGIVIAWFLVRQLIEAIACGVRVLLFVIIVVVILYLVGSAQGWSIIQTINGLL